ncbi:MULTISPECIES: patatin-like phospholipase family protein [unclassified Acinetobacter]|uniref:patatin-like phospholipase family protein n=1 Tax=unclassified Acinetobacter TaxID=196816 RepID=UPI002934E6E8|nr:MULTISPECIES: patatin-like phospholipase family protein [unclassified Acinetobacter]WOE30596.1 patatin-like phospholipase family protein [Acinetobacter sp. SAAs470]WOE38788.1 patatin-like phospholipase family protein [Acinetobacter sp. SAAs474]
MTYILKQHPPALSIRAGSIAKQLIQQEGLHAAQVDILPGAAGGPKGLGIQGLDQAIFGDFLPQAPQRRTLIGSSIGSWRFASIMALGAKAGTERLAQLYTQLSFHNKMTRFEVGEICQNMINTLIDHQQHQLIHHPDYHLAVLAVKSQHIFNSDKTFALFASVLGIVGSNAIARKHNRFFMQRVISQPQFGAQFQVNDDFPTLYQSLTQENVIPWLMASASIPIAMSAVRNIPDAPDASYRDGGLIDYHLDLPFQSKGIVLYPHFSEQIIPGWFDKMFKSRQANPTNQARTLLLSPSAEYLQNLPLGRLPDRKDFTQKGLSNQQRIKMWQQCIAESQRLGDEFLELVEKQNIAAVLHNL